MSGSSAQQDKEPAAAEQQPVKKFRRMGRAESTADMGVMGAFQHLKSEAKQLKTAGVAGLLSGGEAAMKPLLAPYLNGT